MEQRKPQTAQRIIDNENELITGKRITNIPVKNSPVKTMIFALALLPRKPFMSWPKPYVIKNALPMEASES